MENDAIVPFRLYSSAPQGLYLNKRSLSNKTGQEQREQPYAGVSQDQCQAGECYVHKGGDKLMGETLTWNDDGKDKHGQKSNLVPA